MRSDVFTYLSHGDIDGDGRNETLIGKSGYDDLIGTTGLRSSFALPVAQPSVRCGVRKSVNVALKGGGRVSPVEGREIASRGDGGDRCHIDLGKMSRR